MATDQGTPSIRCAGNATTNRDDRGTLPVPIHTTQPCYRQEASSSYVYTQPGVAYPGLDGNAVHPMAARQPIVSIGRPNMAEVGHQPMVVETASVTWPIWDGHLLLSIIMSVLVLACGSWLPLICTLLAMVISCSALYDDLSGTASTQGTKAKVSLALIMAAALLMAMVCDGMVLKHNSVTFGGGGGARHLCASAQFCTIQYCPFAPYHYSYFYHQPVTHSSCYCHIP